MTPMVNVQKRAPRLNLPQNVISHVAPRTKDVSTQLTVHSIGLEQVVLIGAIGASIASAYMNIEEGKTEDVKDDPKEEEEPEPEQEQQEEGQVEEEPVYSIKSPDVNTAKKAVASTKSIVKERLLRLRNSSEDVVEVKVEESNANEGVEEVITKKETKRKPSLAFRVVRKVLLPWTKF